jgi:release factor glutamine methyltransferase
VLKTTTIKQALFDAKKQIASAEAHLDAEILLAHVLHRERAYLFTYPEKTLDLEQMTNYVALVARRAQGEPIAYLLGRRDFWTFSLTVTKDTLIPRHETELLVECSLALIKPSTPRVLELGTGSGAIAIALAIERPHWEIDACDRSVLALEVAQKNALALGVHNIHFFQSDWFSALTCERYDAIVSNPPYLAADSIYLRQGDLRFEPIHALVSGQNGLSDLHYLIQQTKNYLINDGLLLLEHGHDQKDAVHAMLNRSKYQDLNVWQDIQGHDRVSTARYVVKA